jgi:hypothetical protein
MTSRQSVWVRTEFQEFRGDWPPDDPPGFLRWVKSQIATIPKECAASAKIRISTETEYDCSYPVICLEYVRQETDEEMHERDERDKQAMRKAEMKERRILEALKQKYG